MTIFKKIQDGCHSSKMATIVLTWPPVIDLGIIDRYTEHKVLHTTLVVLLALCNDAYGPPLVSILVWYNVILLIKYFIIHYTTVECVVSLILQYNVSMLFQCYFLTSIFTRVKWVEWGNIKLRKYWIYVIFIVFFTILSEMILMLVQ